MCDDYVQTVDGIVLFFGINGWMESKLQIVVCHGADDAPR